MKPLQGIVVHRYPLNHRILQGRRRSRVLRLSRDVASMKKQLSEMWDEMIERLCEMESTVKEIKLAVGAKRTPWRCARIKHNGEMMFIPMCYGGIMRGPAGCTCLDGIAIPDISPETKGWTE